VSGQKDRFPFISETAEQLLDLSLRERVESDHRLVDHQHRGIVHE
jgi:hypothetical protein